MNWIEAVCEPRSLFLAWQAPDPKDRFRYAVGIIERAETTYTLRYFEPQREFQHYNDGRSFDQVMALGYSGYPAFSIKRPVHEDVLPVFLRRLPPRSRLDFAEYVSQFRLRPSPGISDFALLGHTEAKLPNDGFSLVDALDPAASRCDLMLELAGYGHYAKTVEDVMSVGLPVSIETEPTNQYDANAVKVSVRGHTIGYINRLQTKAFQCWLRERQVTAVVERLNGSADRPRAFVFVRVRPFAAQRVA
jgi:hypothetical protein